jgi:hypothetical protein
VKSSVMERSDVAEREGDPTGSLGVAELKKALVNGDLKTVKSMTPLEVATLFRINGRSVLRWVMENRIPDGAFFRTPGHHRRYFEAYIHKLLAEGGMTDRAERQRRIDNAKESAKAGVKKPGYTEGGRVLPKRRFP